MNAATYAGSGGTVGASSREDVIFTLSEECRDVEHGISAGAGRGDWLGHGGDARQRLSASPRVSLFLRVERPEQLARLAAGYKERLAAAEEIATAHARRRGALVHRPWTRLLRLQA